MAQPKRGLGKGLGALIPTGPPGSASMPGWPGALVTGGSHSGSEGMPISGAYLEEIPLGAIKPNPRQPRQAFDEDALAELAASRQRIVDIGDAETTMIYTHVLKVSGGGVRAS